MTSRFAAAGVVAAFTLGLLTATAVDFLADRRSGSLPASVKIISVEPITEDDPRWDCATMGNGRCFNSPEFGETAGYMAYGWRQSGDREVTVSLTGDPLTDCYTAVAAAGLSGDLCAQVAINLG